MQTFIHSCMVIAGGVLQILFQDLQIPFLERFVLTRDILYRNCGWGSFRDRLDLLPIRMSQLY